MPLTYKLRRPFSVPAIGGKENQITELNIDFDEVSAEAIISAYEEHNVRRLNNPGYGNQMLPLLLVAKMNGMIVEDLKAKLRGRDYLVLMRLVESFFDDLDSATKKPEPTPELKDSGLPTLT